MIGNKEKSKIAFNQQAATYDEDIKGQHARSLYPVLLKKLSGLDFNTVLDLGCGTGAVMQAIFESFPDKRVYGIDISENMLQKAKEKLKDKATLTLGDSEHLPYANEMFDVVYCNDSFHHYPAPEKVIAEVYRVLKPTGKFIISDCWQPFFGRIIMNAFMRFSSEGDVKMYSKREICRLLGLHFQNVIWQKANHTSFIVSSIK
ncbi:class I SAM-dependent methyltransferase [Faecalispora sporosphaeroides]|jgi:ubiquinone/menaquinone biosynthesis C-methylase UbiE|uniref:Class I SAM-dependent methyltransferase n=1 Tax=Faecalispora sporosphaeroides TaxID=1549 RepID=A0A928KYB9_9FIRM|nr:class I SAM-dependent methyltransferase [Faecalispora sporosphaeroides]MBE6834355.1 class I SAM-dependent methyltransferase [Faecalispora sporosphaeroides]